MLLVRCTRFDCPNGKTFNRYVRNSSSSYPQPITSGGALCFLLPYVSTSCHFVVSSLYVYTGCANSEEIGGRLIHFFKKTIFTIIILTFDLGFWFILFYDFMRRNEQVLHLVANERLLIQLPVPIWAFKRKRLMYTAMAPVMSPCKIKLTNSMWL